MRGLQDLASLLGDTSLTWAERRTQLQGWRGSAVDSPEDRLMSRMATRSDRTGADRVTG